MKSNNINIDLDTMMDKIKELGSEQIKYKKPHLL